MSSYSDYAAKACALEKSALITLLAFNLFCSLITENSARTRNLFPPNILSNPKRPHECLFVVLLMYRSYIINSKCSFFKTTTELSKLFLFDCLFPFLNCHHFWISHQLRQYVLRTPLLKLLFSYYLHLLK